MRFQKYRFTKAKGLRFMMNGTQKQLKTPAIRKKRVMIRANLQEVVKISLENISTT